MKHDIDEHRALARETQRVRSALDELFELCDDEQLSAKTPMMPIDLAPTSFDFKLPEVEKPELEPISHPDMLEDWFDEPEPTPSSMSGHTVDFDSVMSERSSHDTDDLFAGFSEQETLTRHPMPSDSVDELPQVPDPVDGGATDDVFDQFEW